MITKIDLEQRARDKFSSLFQPSAPKQTTQTSTPAQARRVIKVAK